jgi:TolB protein
MPRALIALAAVLALAGAAAGAGAGPSVVSLAADGAQGSQPATGAAVSGDGDLVAFVSRASLTGAPAGTLQLYVRDRRAGRTILASSSALGAPANADVQDLPGEPAYAISADGRYVVFASAATNLVPDDVNGSRRDVFRKDLATGAIVLVDRGPDGAQANDAVDGDPDLSGDGRRVVYLSGAATNLFPGATGAGNVVVRDIDLGTSTLASAGPGGVPANGQVAEPVISEDGRRVAFTAGPGTTNLAPGDTNGASDVVVRDLAAGTSALADVATSGSAPGGGSGAALSGDGSVVAFETTAPLDPARDANGLADVYVRDLAAGTTTLVSARAGGVAAGNGASRRAALSADGTRVAFESAATDLLAADGNGATGDVLARTLPTGVLVRASERVDGLQRARPAAVAAIAPDGGAVTFDFDDGLPSLPLSPDDANGLPDVLAVDLGPTDLSGPTLALTGPDPGASVTGRSVTVAGRAADPSGVVAVRVGDRVVSVGADGAFAADVLLDPGANALRVTALDGAGNATTLVRSVTRTAATAGTPAVRVGARQLRVRVRGRTVTVAYRLPPGALRVRARVWHLVGKGSTASWRAMGKPVAASPAPGVRRVTLRPGTLRNGRYQARLTVTSAGGVTPAAAGFVVAPGSAR